MTVPEWMSNDGVQHVGKLVLATLLGGAIGLNRELHQKPAGFRTHAMVALGAALMTMIAVDLSGQADRVGGGRSEADFGNAGGAERLAETVVLLGGDVDADHAVGPRVSCGGSEPVRPAPRHRVGIAH